MKAGLDGDGDIDTVVQTDDVAGFDNHVFDSPTVVWINDGQAHFDSRPQAEEMRGLGATKLFDMDGDGNLDLLESGMRLWINNGEGDFRRGDDLGNYAAGSDFSVADLDGDDDVDVVIPYSVPFHGFGHLAGTLHREGPELLPQHGFPFSAMSASSGDVDRDGDIDTVFGLANTDAGPFQDVAFVYLNDGHGNYGEERVITTQAEWAQSAYAADIDGDGDADVLSASTRDHKVAWYENQDGNGSFGQQRVIDVLGDFPTSVYATDIDADGDVDVVSRSLGMIDGIVVWYENTDGRGAFGRRQIIADRAGHAVAADLDGDTDLDVLVAAERDQFLPPGRDNMIVWYPNLLSDPKLGDANRDGRFDQLDIIHVLQAAKYLTGDHAVWEEGDWNGDGAFDQFDIVVALGTGDYLQGPRAAQTAGVIVSEMDDNTPRP